MPSNGGKSARGNKRPSQLDVAKAAGVSRATVSVVLTGNVMISDQTRQVR